ncbi:hypothetical protein LX32DRAFT_517734, partial [Colletotrichum zoysiae]
HARAFLLSRSTGSTVLVGVNDDAEIAKVKGHPVMALSERYVSISGCRWVSRIVPNAPYRCDLQWLDKVGATIAVYGGDIAIDASGRDSNVEVKEAGRYLSTKRNQGPGGISTTALIDRILLPQ